MNTGIVYKHLQSQIPLKFTKYFPEYLYYKGQLYIHKSKNFTMRPFAIIH